MVQPWTRINPHNRKMFVFYVGNPGKTSTEVIVRFKRATDSPDIEAAEPNFVIPSEWRHFRLKLPAER